MLDANDTRFLDSYKKYCNKGWYGGIITSEGIDSWVKNFQKENEMKFNPKKCAHFLMHSLIFYQENQMIAIISSIKDKILTKINQDEEEKIGKRISEKELNGLCNEYIEKSCIISAATPRDVGSSAHSVIRLWRNNGGIDVANVQDLQNEILKGKLHIFFVDDFVGTGTKMKGFLEDNIFPDSSSYGFRSVAEVINKYSDTVDFNIAVFALHERGKTEISKAFPKINFYYGDLFDAKYDLTSLDCVYYDVFSDDKSDIIDYIKKKNQEIDPDNEYSLFVPIAFQHGCPNNSLSLYYKKNSSWQRLMSESHPKTQKERH